MSEGNNIKNSIVKQGANKMSNSELGNNSTAEYIKKKLNAKVVETCYIKGEDIMMERCLIRINDNDSKRFVIIYDDKKSVIIS